MKAHARLLSAALALVSGTAFAAPPEELPVSNEAAMMGGAVRAAGRSAGSFWYNPALLGRVHLSETEANGEVLGLRWTQAPNVVALERLDGTRSSTSLRDAQFVAVPTTFAGAIALTPKLTIGYGLFQPLASDFSASADVQEGEAGTDETVFQLRYTQSSQRYYGGLGLGYEFSPNFQMGASLFAAYDQTERTQQLFLARSGELAASGLVDESASIGSFGLAAAFGVRGRLGRIVAAAASVRAPTFVLTQSIEGGRTVSESTAEATQTRIETLDPEIWRQSQLRGWEFGAGLSVGPGDWLVSLDLSAQTGTRPRSGPLAAGPSFGVQLGGNARLSERLSLGAGAFYASPSGNDESLGALSLHRVGGSLGFELRRRLELANRNNIEFRTVIAAWYAYSFGTSAGLEVETSAQQAIAAMATTQVSARSHLVMLHIGSALAF